MGIPAYFSYIIKTYKKIVKSVNDCNEHFDSLYMDCNSIIYDVAHSIETQDADAELIIIQKVIEKIDDYILLINPSNTIFIAFDGVAPFAKMEQQRSRRYKGWYTNNILDDKTNIKWNTTNITPGTIFMNKLMSHISLFFKHREQTYKVKNIIVSTSHDPGEGEHKLFQHMRDNNSINENVIVYGLDSDLIMLSLFHRDLFKNIYIFREAPEFLKHSIQITFDPSNPNEAFLIDIDILSSSILSEMNCKFPDKHRIYDYIFLCFFLGNDFLPHFPAMNIRTHGIQVLLDIYRLYIGNKPDNFIISKKTENQQIQWNNVSKVIKEISRNEHQLLLNEYSVRDKWDSKKWKCNGDENFENLLLNSPVIYRQEERYICPTEKFWEERYYK